MFRNFLAVIRAIAFAAVVFTLISFPLLNIANGQTESIVIDKPLYASLAASAGMTGSSAEFHSGQGSWNSNRSVVEWYISPEVHGVGEKTIGDIETVTYYSKNGPINTTGVSEGVDFALYIYTKGSAHGWYGERLTAEPLYSKNYSDPVNTWNLWTTDHLTWYSGDHAVPMGWAGAPTLAEMQADAFRWSDYWPAANTSVVNYNAMKILAFKFGTGSGWSQYFNGYLDTVQINFKDGDQLIFDLENQPDMLYVDDNWVGLIPGQDPDGDGPAHAFGSDAFSTVQSAINAAAESATISIFPGSYPTGISATKVDPNTGGAGGNSFIIFVNKTGVTLQGVNEDATPITSAANVAANISATANAPTFGASVLFIQANDVTVQGLEVTPFTPNKTIEVWGNNFTLRHSLIQGGANGSTVYLNEEKASSYSLEQNHLRGGVAIASGAGSNGSRSSRKITGNLITSSFYGIGFRGTNPNVAWFTKPVGGAVIEGNSFSGSPYGHVYADGAYTEAELLWDEILEKNTFDKSAVLTNSASEIANHAWNFGYNRPNLRRIASTIQSELDRALTGDTLTVSAGLFPEELTFKTAVSDVRLVGAGADKTIIEAADSTVGFTVTLNGPSSLIQGVTIQNNATAPNSIGIAWGYQAAGSQLVETKVAGFPTGVYLSSGVDSAVIENNWITGNANGLLIEGEINNASIRFNDISANDLTDDYFAGRPNASIRILDSFNGENNIIRYNALVGSSRGVDNNASEEIVVEKNWWGSKYGPTQGILTEGLVDADPWLCSGVDTQPTVIGFQPAATDTCTAGAGTRLVFITQPIDTMVNVAFATSSALRVEDENGSLAVTFAKDVTISLNTNSQPAALKGNVSVGVVDGMVTFPGLSVDRWGKDFTLTASADGLSPATSNRFNVLAHRIFLPITANR
jgi:hypothetical protein